MIFSLQYELVLCGILIRNRTESQEKSVFEQFLKYTVD